MRKNVKDFISFSSFLVLLILLPGCQNRATAQKIKGVNSLEFYENYQHLLSDEEVVIIDGRTEGMFSGGHLQNAINIDADAENLVHLLQQHLDVPQIVVYCTTIRRTTRIVNVLKPLYKGEIIFITDGIQGWVINGLPYGIPKNEQHSIYRY